MRMYTPFDRFALRELVVMPQVALTQHGLKYIKVIIIDHLGTYTCMLELPHYSKSI